MMNDFYFESRCVHQVTCWRETGYFWNEWAPLFVFCFLPFARLFNGDGRERFMTFTFLFPPPSPLVLMDSFTTLVFVGFARGASFTLDCFIAKRSWRSSFGKRTSCKSIACRFLRCLTHLRLKKENDDLLCRVSRIFRQISRVLMIIDCCFFLA